MKADRLVIGDNVRVDINAAQTTIIFDGELLYMPAAPGESWIFKDERGLYYISEGCTITRLVD